MQVAAIMKIIEILTPYIPALVAAFRGEGDFGEDVSIIHAEIRGKALTIEQKARLQQLKAVA